jgi:hypothetical protein
MGLELKDKIQICQSLEDLPDFKMINSISRGVNYRVVFSNKIKSKREQVGKKWQLEFPNHQIGIHTIKSEINIIKLITNKEIEEYQNFFEKCAKDYRELSSKLINKFIVNFNIEVNSKYPMDTLNPSGKCGYEQVGEMDEWKYFFHGIHCGFINLNTGQKVETPLSFGLEFGELDPYFFSRFINSTKEYQPLPIFIYDNYWDGKRVLKKMVELGKFEMINSNFPNQTGIVVKDREKIEIKVFQEMAIIPNDKINFKIKRKTSFLEKIKLKMKRLMQGNS